MSTATTQNTPGTSSSAASVGDIGPNKAIASGLGGAIVTIVLWVITATSHTIQVPPEVAAALTTVVGTALVWFVPHRFS